MIKLYVEESGAETVADRARRVDRIATSRIAYAEARAAFARLERTNRTTRTERRRMVSDLDREWSAYQVVDVTESLVRHAGALAERHALRGDDAVQLASALALRDAGVGIEFMSFDAHLSRAAARERLAVPNG